MKYGKYIYMADLEDTGSGNTFLYRGVVYCYSHYSILMSILCNLARTRFELYCYTRPIFLISYVYNYTSYYMILKLQ